MPTAHRPASLPLQKRPIQGAPVALLDSAKRFELTRGSVLLREGQALDYWFLLVAGALRLSCTAGSGRAATLAILAPGDILSPGVRGALAPEARAVTSSTGLRFSSADLDRALERDPDVVTWVHQALQRQVDDLRRSLVRVLSLRVHDRVFELLCELAGIHGQPVPGGVRIGLPLAQETVASLVGATRESVNRSIRRLEAGGLIRRSSRCYVLLDQRSVEPAPSRLGPSRRMNR